MTATVYKCPRFYMCTHSPLPNKALHFIPLVVGELAIQYSAPAGFLRGHQVANFCLSRSLSD